MPARALLATFAVEVMLLSGVTSPSQIAIARAGFVVFTGSLPLLCGLIVAHGMKSTIGAASLGCVNGQAVAVMLERASARDFVVFVLEVDAV